MNRSSDLRTNISNSIFDYGFVVWYT